MLKQSEEAYKAAQVKASSMQPTDPIRLGLALNFSVFYYEIMGKTDKACELAKTVCRVEIVESTSSTWWFYI